MKLYAMTYSKGPRKGKICLGGQGSEWFLCYTSKRTANQLRQPGEKVREVKIGRVK